MAGLFGCIADDITGGTDLAGSLAATGCRVLQIIAHPDSIDFGEPPDPNYDAIVISMKIRSVPPDIAVNAALAAHDALREWGADRIFFKYCSTFDSTAQGNIGPIASVLQDRVGTPLVTFCPSFPANGRTLYQGHLFVGDQLVSNSSMRDHPLNPMTEPDLRKWLALQAPGRRIGAVSYDTVRGGPQAVAERLAELRTAEIDCALLDATSDSDIEILAEACRHLPLNTGGSAFGAALGRLDKAAANTPTGVFQMPQMQSVAVLSGSCSTATRQQAARAKTFLPVLQIDPAKLGPSGELPDGMLQEAAGYIAGGGRVFVTSTPVASAGVVQVSGESAVMLGNRIEQAMARTARFLHENGVRAFIIAGGETSGAICSALSLDRLEVGPEIAPGVPWMRDACGSGIHVACKSGNFGGPDFFAEAMGMIGMGRASG